MVPFRINLWCNQNQLSDSGTSIRNSTTTSGARKVLITALKYTIIQNNMSMHICLAMEIIPDPVPHLLPSPLHYNKYTKLTSLNVKSLNGNLYCLHICYIWKSCHFCLPLYPSLLHRKHPFCWLFLHWRKQHSLSLSYQSEVYF